MRIPTGRGLMPVSHMKRVGFRPVLLGLGLLACGNSDEPANRGSRPLRYQEAAAVVGVVLDSLGYPVEGADVSVKSYLVPDSIPPRRSERCVGGLLNTGSAETNAAGQFQVVLRHRIGPEACGVVVVHTDGGQSDTISGMRIRYRDPVRVILP